MQLQALLFAVVASLLCVAPAILALPQTTPQSKDAATTDYKIPKAGPHPKGFKDLKDVKISFPPPNPLGACQICDEEDGCTDKGRAVYQYSWTVENMYAYRADSDDYGWWAAQMNRTYPGHASFAIVNNLKPKTHANLFEVVTINYAESVVAKQNRSVWTKVEPMTSCLTSFQGEMKFWQDSMSVVNVYQSVHKK